MTDTLDTVQAPNKAHYLAAADTLAAGPAPAWLHRVRKAGVAQFVELDFPSRRQEDWRFTNVTPIVSGPFRTLTAPCAPAISNADLSGAWYREAGWIELVFVNGYFAPALSSTSALPSGVVAGSLAEAIASGAASVETLLTQAPNSTIFQALNSALLQDGAYVHIPANTVVEAPIHVLHVSTATDEPAAVHPRNLVAVGRDAQVSIVESYASLGGGKYFNNVVTDVTLDAGARVTWHKIVNESPEGHHLASTRVAQSRDSSFRSFAITLAGKIVRNGLSTALNGEGAESLLNGLYLTDGDQLVDNAVAIDHAKPHCSSWIGYKGVLDGASSAVFSGKIMVRRNAQKTDSKQLNRNLLLSDSATVNTKPLLEIFADDVKCTHGATVGQHPKEVIFYFRSRGMSEAMARGMLTYGFADEVINQIAIAPVRSRLDRIVYERYSPI